MMILDEFGGLAEIGSRSRVVGETELVLGVDEVSRDGASSCGDSGYSLR